MFGLRTLLITVVTLAAVRPSNAGGYGPEPAVLTCGITSLNWAVGSLRTPGYPGNYGNNTDCVYTIRPGNTESFTVNFRACSCEIEDSSDCSADYIQFGGGPKVCGTQTDTSFSADSSEGKVEVVFHSNSDVTATGCFINFGVDKTDEFLIPRCSTTF